MNNQTVNNEENNRGGKTKKELEIALRSVWQAHSTVVGTRSYQI